MSFILGGLAQGLGQGIVQENKQILAEAFEQRRMALEKLKMDRADGRFVQQRQFAIEDREANQNFQREMFDRQSAAKGPPSRNILEDAAGRKRYVDDGSLVFSDVDVPQDTKAPTVRTVKQRDGSEVAVQWDSSTGAWVPLNAPQGGNAVGGPAKLKLTELQSKQIGFARRMDDSDKIIGRLETEGYDPTDLSDGLAREGGVVGNYFVSEEGQQYVTAARDWIAGTLRLDSGAAVPEEEFWRYFRTYFPQPGDAKSVVAQKAKQRASVRLGMQEASGGYIDAARDRDAETDQGNSKQKPTVEELLKKY